MPIQIINITNLSQSENSSIISGIVHLPNDTVVNGAVVILYFKNNNNTLTPITSTSTDANGSFSINVNTTNSNYIIKVLYH